MLWEVQKPAMSTGQTQTYPFWQKDKTAWCLPARLSMAKSFFAFLALSTPDHPTPVLAKSTIHFTAAYASDCLLLSSNLSSKYLSNDSLQRHLKDTLRKAWWWQRISRNKCVMSDTKACYEHWADADISFLRKEKTALSALCTLHYCTLCFSLVSSPNHPTLSPLKTLSTSRQPTFWTACCYRRTFPPSISRMTAFNAIWKILSERLDDGSGLNCIWLLWGGWLIRTLQVFVLIVSSRISRNRCVMSDTRACYEHWADADISFLRKEKTA